MLFCEGEHKDVDCVTGTAKRGQKSADIFVWDIEKTPEENLKEYAGQVIIKLHRWWAGSHQSIEYGDPVIPMQGYLQKHMVAALGTGALIIANRKFAAHSGMIDHCWLVDTGEGKYWSSVADAPVGTGKNVGYCGNSFANRLYSLSVSQEALLGARLEALKKSRKPVKPAHYAFDETPTETDPVEITEEKPEEGEL